MKTDVSNIQVEDVDTGTAPRIQEAHEKRLPPSDLF